MTNSNLIFTNGFVKLFPNILMEKAQLTLESDITDHTIHLIIDNNQAQIQENSTILCNIEASGNDNILFFYGKGGYSVVVSGETYRFIMLPASSLISSSIHINLPKIDFIFLQQDHIIVPETNAIQNDTKQAMVLGAGLATRFEPVSGDLTNIPKPSVPLYNGMTVIEHITQNLHRHGIRQLTVNTFYKPESIKKALSKHSEVNTIYIDEEAPSGTAGGLIKALQRGLIDTSQPLIIVQGDAVSNINLSLFMAKHIKNNAAVSIAAKRVSDKDVSNFGIIASDHSGQWGDSGNITFFFEKPTLEESQGHRLASTGFYILAPEIYQAFIQTYTDLGKETYDYAKDFFPEVFKLIQQKEVRSSRGTMTMWVHEISEYWSDIGNPMQYIATVKDIYSGKVGDTHLFHGENVPPIFWHNKNLLPSHIHLNGNIISVGT